MKNFSHDINANINQIKKDTGNSIDINFRTLYLNDKKICLVYNEVLTADDKINDFVLKHLTNLITNHDKTNNNLIDYLSNVLPGVKTNTLTNFKDFYYYLNSGFVFIFVDNENKVLTFETRSNLDRSIDTAQDEPSIKGPKEAFIENYNANVGLIRKRLKTKDLWLEEMLIGKDSKTKVGIMYLNGIAEVETVDEVKNRLKKININVIMDSGYIQELIGEKEKSSLPLIQQTERPDLVVNNIAEGKIAIIVENSPKVLLVPAFLVDFIHANEDCYQIASNANFIRILRFIALIIAVFAPAFYIAITTFNQESLPVSVLLNFATQQNNVPFPTFIDAIIMSVIFELLRESDLRMPSVAGTSISIVGALVLGDAAVTAGLASPIMVIVIAMTAVASLLFTNVDFINAIRGYRFILMILATICGFIGIIVGTLFILFKLASLKSFGKPYLIPFAPLYLEEQSDAITRLNRKNITKRKRYLTKTNIVKQRMR